MIDHMQGFVIGDYQEFLELYTANMLLFVGNFAEWKNGNIPDENMMNYIYIAESWNKAYKSYGHADDNPAIYKHNFQMVKRAKESVRNGN